MKGRPYSTPPGPTPVVPLEVQGQKGHEIWCKLEFMNRSGSTKDRVASVVLTKAFRSGRIGRGSVVVEASSGSTAISMAMVCAELGVRFVAVMPKGVSNERTMLIKALGAEIHLGPEDAGMDGCMRIAAQLVDELGAYAPRQFENVDNANAHRYGTAREIATQVRVPHVDAVVAGIGTGGTLAGLWRGLNDLGHPARMFAARPVSSARSCCAGRRSCCEKGHCYCDVECSSFSTAIPGVVEHASRLFTAGETRELEVVNVGENEAVEMTRRLLSGGFPVGPSSGLNAAAACRVATELGPHSTVVTVFPDRVERYFSTSLFERGAAAAGTLGRSPAHGEAR